jgi:hypothetical protein
MPSHQAVAPIVVRPRTYGEIVGCGEVAYLYCSHCVPSCTINAVPFDEQPCNRALDAPTMRFQFPGCRKPLEIHLREPVTPATERFLEAY